jgi:META domain
MRTRVSERWTQAVLTALVTFLLCLTCATGAARAAESPALSGEQLEELTGHGDYRGLSITGADGGHPIGRPEELRLGFHTLIEYLPEGSEEEPEEKPMLGWISNCNAHSYRLEATATRLDLSEEVNTKKRCSGRAGEEEAWLGRFFAASPHWRLTNGRLTLMARGSRIVMHHRRPHRSQ